MANQFYPCHSIIARQQTLDQGSASHHDWPKRRIIQRQISSAAYLVLVVDGLCLPQYSCEWHNLPLHIIKTLTPHLRIWSLRSLRSFVVAYHHYSFCSSYYNPSCTQLPPCKNCGQLSYLERKQSCFDK